jgi:superfamily I DNA/RNA helicase
MDWVSVVAISSGGISMMTALGALFLSYKVYLRQKSLENENHFFRYKMEQYQAIIQAAIDLHDVYYNAFDDIKLELSERFKNDDNINELADVIDERTDNFRMILYKYASFLPEEIVKKLDSFYNNLYDQSELLDTEEVTSIKKEAIDKALEKLDKYEDDLEEIVNLMRKDLGIESIDRRLKNRTHK